jgi:hypothetical protein
MVVFFYTYQSLHTILSRSRYIRLLLLPYLLWFMLTGWLYYIYFNFLYRALPFTWVSEPYPSPGCPSPTILCIYAWNGFWVGW